MAPQKVRTIPWALPWPIRGLSENLPYGEQEEGTTPDCQNVRPYDTLENRARGGSRPGSSRYYASAINGSNPIQAIRSTAVAFDVNTVNADTQLVDENFTYSNGGLDTVSGLWTTFDCNSQGYFLASNADSIDVSSNLCVAPVADGNGRRGTIHDAVSGISAVYILRMDLVIEDLLMPNSAAGHGCLAFRLNQSDPLSTRYFRMVIRRTNITTWFLQIQRAVDPDTGRTDILTGANFDPGISGGAGGNTTVTLELQVNGDNIRGLVGSTERISGYITSSENDQFGVGFGMMSDAHSPLCTVDNFDVFAGVQPALLRSVRSVVVSGGNIYTAEGDTQPVLATSGTAALSSIAVRVDAVAAFGSEYFCDGTPEGYRILDFSTDTISVWGLTVETTGVLPVGADGTTTYGIDSLDQGAVTFTVSEDLTAELTANESYIIVEGSTGNDGAYFVTGVSGTTVITVRQPIPNSTADGTLRKANRACRFITLYRGRVTLSGLATDPHNWFMLRVGNPLNIDYSPTTTSAIDAVAGNNTNVGEMGDVISALAPLNDDILVMGGDHTIELMRGDPAAGGEIDNVTRQVGILGPDAFAWSPDGVLYFMSNIGLMKMIPGNLPQPVSQGRLDARLTDINLNTNRVLLLWDRDRQGLHIFLTPVSEAAVTHYWWDQRTDGFWPDVFPNETGPTAVWNYDGDAPSDRAALLGGFDSFIRLLDDATTNDDTTSSTSAISSDVILPIIVTNNRDKVAIKELVVVLGENSGAATVELYAASTPQQVVINTIAATTPLISKALTAGRSIKIRQRLADNALAIRIFNTTASRRWALESVRALIQTKGVKRQVD